VPRIAKKTPKKRLNLEMDERVHQKLVNLRDLTEADTMVEVIRRALAVYEFLWAKKREGRQLIVRGNGDEIELYLM